MIKTEVYDRLNENSKDPFIIKNAITEFSISWADVEQYLNNYLHHSLIEILSDGGKKIPMVKRPMNWGSSYDFNVLSDLIKKGHTFILYGMNRYNLKLNELCNNIENFINGYADIHVYAGLSSNSYSFNIHKDTPHNLILQIDGECEWEVYTNKVVEPGEHPVIHQTLTPGDILYFPKEFYHRCLPKGKRISLSLPFSKGERSNRNWLYL